MHCHEPALSGVLCHEPPYQVICNALSGVLCHEPALSGVVCHEPPYQVICDALSGVLCDSYRQERSVLCDSYSYS